MRVLFAIDPSLAHLYPLVPTAWALQCAGHEVRLASYAGFADSIAATGLTPVALGNAAERAARLADDPLEPKGPEEVVHYADVLGLDAADREYWYLFFQYLLTPTADYLRKDRAEADDLIAFARTWKPDLVIWDFTQAAGAVAARACGAAHARMPPGMDTFGWSLDRLAGRRAELRAAGLDENPLATLVSPLAQRYGIETDDELLVGQWTIDLLPPGLSLPTSTRKVATRWIPYTGASTFAPWLHEQPRRPRLAMTLGESARRFIRGDWDRTPRIMEALDGLDIEVIATLNDVQTEGASVPSNVRRFDWVPLTQLLPTCTALIHHGGMGTFAAATAAKVPQIVCDTEESILIRTVREDEERSDVGTYMSGVEYGVRDPDQVERPRVKWVMPAKKVEATPCSNFVVKRGAGARLNHRAQSAAEIRALILQVLYDRSFREGADAIHDMWMAMPSPDEIVPTLERLTAEFHGRR